MTEPKEKTGFTVIVAVHHKDGAAGYGIIRTESYKSWEQGEAEPDVPDAFGLLYGNSELTETFQSWKAAADHVAECGGEIDDVVPCMAY